jgi:predicted GNAT family acetyltransferase
MDYTFRILERDANHGTFLLEQQQKTLAWMEYTRSPEDSISITINHTEVDSTQKGLGLGKILLQEVQQYITQNQMNLIAQCPYVQSQLKKQ